MNIKLVLGREIVSLTHLEVLHRSSPSSSTILVSIFITYNAISIIVNTIEITYACGHVHIYYEYMYVCWASLNNEIAQP